MKFWGKDKKEKDKDKEDRYVNHVYNACSPPTDDKTKDDTFKKIEQLEKENTDQKKAIEDRDQEREQIKKRLDQLEQENKLREEEDNKNKEELKKLREQLEEAKQASKPAPGKTTIVCAAQKSALHFWLHNCTRCIDNRQL